MADILKDGPIRRMMREKGLFKRGPEIGEIPSTKAIKTTVPEYGPVEVRNWSGQPLYVRAFQSKVSGKIYVDVWLEPSPIGGPIPREEVRPDGFTIPNIYETT